MKKLLLLFCVISSLFAHAPLQAQCSKVYFYRLTSLASCEFPVYLYQDGQLVATLNAGDRFYAEVCSSGTYTFQAKLNPEAIALSKATISVDGRQNYFVKAGCVPGVDLATIKDETPEEGLRDIGRESRFTKALSQIRLNAPAQPAANGAQAAQPAPQSGAYQKVQIINNFKFEITDITRAGSTAQINFKITNLAPDDRLLYLGRRFIHFYDDMGAMVYADQLCLANNCYNSHYTWCEGKRECLNALSGPRYYGGAEAENVMPSGIPLNASLTFQNLNKRATKLLRGAIWFGCCSTDGGYTTVVNEIPYGEIVFPTPIDPNNPNNRVIAALGVELKSCQVVGPETRLNYVLRNLGPTPFDVVFQQGAAFDDQGNQYAVSAFAYANEARQPLNRQWNNINNQGKTLQANGVVELQLIIDNVGPSAASLKRIDLFFNGYDLSWQDAPLLRNGPPAAAPAAYIPYADLQQRLARNENVVGRKVILENIYFSSGSDQLLNESYAQLNQLAALLLANPRINIEISGHTDALGDDVSNMLLSQKRADAIKYHLISKSISPARIISIGKGENEFIESNDSEQGRSKNRRVELKIIE